MPTISSNAKRVVESERLLAKGSRDDEDDERRESQSSRYSQRWKSAARIVFGGSLAIMAVFAVAQTQSSSLSSNTLYQRSMNIYGSREAGASTATKRKDKINVLPRTSIQTAQAELGYADVDTALLGASERNMIEASIAIEDIQRKIKRLEKAKRQRALNIQDVDEYLEDEVVPQESSSSNTDSLKRFSGAGVVEDDSSNSAEEEEGREDVAADAKKTAAAVATAETEEAREERERQEAVDFLLTGKKPDDDSTIEEQHIATTVPDKKLEEELKEEEKKAYEEVSLEERVDDDMSSSSNTNNDDMEEMALAFQKEMEKTALEDDDDESSTAASTEEENKGEELKKEETTTTTTPLIGEAEEVVVKEGETKETKFKTSTTPLIEQTEEYLNGFLSAMNTKRSLTDTEFSKLQELLKFNSEKRGIEFGQVPENKHELCPSSALYRGTCECSTCALVLPMPDMVGTSLGKEIDSHACVARMNAQYIEVQNHSDANKLAHPKDYGSKTDFVFSNVVEHTLLDLLENLNSTNGRKLNQSVKHKFMHVPFWRPSSAVFDFLEEHNDWKIVPQTVTKETSDLFKRMEGAENKQWSSGFLAYVMLSRHYCAKTTVYSYWKREEDPSSVNYVTNSKGGARKMWNGHSFGGEHEFIKNAALNHDYGTRVRYLDALGSAIKPTDGQV